MSLEQVSRALKAAADPSRLRLLAALSEAEASVGELQTVLGQSQPRISRHLRLLTEAGLVQRFREGHWVYYRLEDGARARTLQGAIQAWFDPRDPQLTLDRQALADVKTRRRKEAYAPGVKRAPLGFTGARPERGEIAAAVADVLPAREFDSVLSLGCGTPGLLESLAPRAQRLIGVETQRAQRNLARTRVADARLANCSIRAADARALSFADESFDCVALDEVLSASEEPRAVLQEALRVLRPSSVLLILDRIEPVLVQLKPRGPGATLIENQLVTRLAEQGCELQSRYWFPGRQLAYALFAAQRNPARLRAGPQAGVHTL